MFLCLGRHQGVDITNPRSLRVALDGHSPDVVVNTAAYAWVDRAEGAADAAFAVNASGVAALAELCAERGIPIVHLSTDYIFDGRKQAPYVEDDKASPINVYGASKAAGEAALYDNADRYLILRTSWLYSCFGTNFVKSNAPLSPSPGRDCRCRRSTGLSDGGRRRCRRNQSNRRPASRGKRSVRCLPLGRRGGRNLVRLRKRDLRPQNGARGEESARRRNIKRSVSDRRSPTARFPT